MNKTLKPIGGEAVQALVQNKTLIRLNLKEKQIGDESAKALATNNTLTSLDVSYNQIGDEGAKALAQNRILTRLNVSCNEIGDEWIEALRKTRRRNYQDVIQRRNQFIQVIVILIRDLINPHSSSFIALLPHEIFWHVLSFFELRAEQSIRKSSQQIFEFAKFIFENITTLNEVLRNQQVLKIIEQRVAEKSIFRFFQQQALPSSLIIVPKIEEEPKKNDTSSNCSLCESFNQVTEGKKRKLEEEDSEFKTLEYQHKRQCIFKK